MHKSVFLKFCPGPLLQTLFFTTADQMVEASEDRHSMVWEHGGAGRRGVKQAAV